jgi:ABC-type branched-subunit amino acid transport system ATPase component
VLFNVDFEVEEGEVIALLGTNGAGKSTLLRAIGGITPPSNGAIFYDAEDITYLPAHEHVARGIVTVPGGKGVFAGLTVAENLRLAAWAHADADQAEQHQASEAVFGYFPILRERLREDAANLSGGQQQMLALAQAFLSRPRLLMIDELSLGLAPVVVEQLLEIVRAIAAQGTTIILVEQSVNVALTVAERAVFMEKGEVKFSGSTAELLRRPDILRSVYLKGTSASRGRIAVHSYERTTDAALALDVRNVSVHFGGVQAVDEVSFTLTEGAALGIIGPNGAGKTTLFDIISGFVTPTGGEIHLFGEDITDKGPDQRVALGLLRSFQDARLFPALTVRENITVAMERHLGVRSAAAAALHLPNVRRAEERAAARVDRLIELFALGASRDKFVRELSTGQRRIVDMACVMAAEPRVLLLDEPSSGIAQKEAEELGPLLSRIRYETGCSLLVIEHDMPLILAVSEELLALELGGVVTRGAPQDVIEHPQVVASYLGTSEEAFSRSGAIPD